MAPPSKGPAAARRLVLVLESELGGMRGTWSATTPGGASAPAVVASGSWVREGREDDAPIALLVELGDGKRAARLLRGRHGDGELVIAEVVQSLAFELF